MAHSADGSCAETRASARNDDDNRNVNNGNPTHSASRNGVNAQPNKAPALGEKAGTAAVGAVPANSPTGSRQTQSAGGKGAEAPAACSDPRKTSLDDSASSLSSSGSSGGGSGGSSRRQTVLKPKVSHRCLALRVNSRCVAALRSVWLRSSARYRYFLRSRALSTRTRIGRLVARDAPPVCFVQRSAPRPFAFARSFAFGSLPDPPSPRPPPSSTFCPPLTRAEDAGLPRGARSAVGGAPGAEPRADVGPRPAPARGAALPRDAGVGHALPPAGPRGAGPDGPPPGAHRGALPRGVPRARAHVPLPLVEQQPGRACSGRGKGPRQRHVPGARGAPGGGGEAAAAAGGAADWRPPRLRVVPRAPLAVPPRHGALLLLHGLLERTARASLTTRRPRVWSPRLVDLARLGRLGSCPCCCRTTPVLPSRSGGALSEEEEEEEAPLRLVSQSETDWTDSLSSSSG
eukprot:1039799-Prorocentrum_minimum.AAC.2